MIVFRPIPPLPIRFSSMKASMQQTGVLINWQVENEGNTKLYEVEKSIDGVNFIKIGTINANNTGTASYNWVDLVPNEGNNYYRIRLVTQSGSVAYSQVALVKTGSQVTPGIAVYPNPIVDGVIGLQMNNLPKGKYKIRVINSIGEIMLNKTIEHLGASSTEPLSLAKNIPRGGYKLEVVYPNNDVTTVNLTY